MPRTSVQRSSTSQLFHKKLREPNFFICNDDNRRKEARRNTIDCETGCILGING